MPAFSGNSYYELRVTDDSAAVPEPSTMLLVTGCLLERGVRFVLLHSGGGHIEDTWDGHNDCISNHELHAGETGQPSAAL